MQRISVSNLKPGMIIAKNIFDINGKLLLGAGTVINNKIIRRMVMNKITAAYIRNPLTDLDDDWLKAAIENVPQMISEETIVKSAGKIRHCFSDVCSSTKIDVDNIKQIAESILEEILDNCDAMINLGKINIYDNDTFIHSANVAALTAIMGTKMGYGRKQLLELTIGAILHDVGKLLIPVEILTKPDKLTSEEFEIIKRHPGIGFEILRKNKALPLLSAHVAYQHHEQYNGKGYGRAIKGERIHKYARLVSVIDVYDALTSDRHYRKAFLPHEAYEIMMTMSANFDQQILFLFLNQLTIYPVGITVELSNGATGIVERILPGLQIRPTVRVISEKVGAFLREKSYSLDLSQNLNVTITKVLSEEEICQLMFPGTLGEKLF
ncbi:MAG: HD-GYP domain-containing protein [Sporomusaceae bacterium]|jgi:HD-GYP domain-containing protein (c-di-GMP phosphodiesterase class II)|nr:HD-GYP domain-containing protein [Sporomusaceae bacterium]